jgi:septum formation protein
MLVLASTSPRRRQLLALAGWPYQIASVEVDERTISGETGRAYLLRLAQDKALAAKEQAPPDCLVVAADTTVVDDEEILGKPVDNFEATSMLTRLRGRVHQVYTGLAVLRMADGKMLTDWCSTDVKMRAYRDDEIQAYVQSGDALDKAGSYAIQHPNFKPVESLSGCFANVVGLPICHLAHLLQRLGVGPDTGAKGMCLDIQHYDCALKELVTH